MEKQNNQKGSKKTTNKTSRNHLLLLSGLWTILVFLFCIPLSWSALNQSLNLFATSLNSRSLHTENKMQSCLRFFSRVLNRVFQIMLKKNPQIPTKPQPNIIMQAYMFHSFQNLFNSAALLRYAFRTQQRSWEINTCCIKELIKLQMPRNGKLPLQTTKTSCRRGIFTPYCR